MAEGDVIEQLKVLIRAGQELERLVAEAEAHAKAGRKLEAKAALDRAEVIRRQMEALCHPGGH